ncbi:MAG TPA: hypothetical protein DEQ02_10520 [Ruminococcaceae bacterium]|nr:hypothetical protein [Oscillospiraceae bacterium]
MGNIYVVSNPAKRLDEPVNLELLSKAFELAQSKNGMVVLISMCGDAFEEAVADAYLHGADKIMLLSGQAADPLTAYICFLSQQIRVDVPECVLFSDEGAGKEISSRLSVILDCGLTADCIDVYLDDSDEYVFARTALSDSVVAKIKGKTGKIKMATVKRGVFFSKPCGREKGGSPQVMVCEVGKFDQNEIPGRFYEIIEEISVQKPGDVDLSQSRVIFCAGRGVNDSESLESLFAAAEKLGAGVACTRCLVDEGIMPRSRQVGQSGKSISPQIYVALGVSGASQHLVGVKNADFVIAINSDKNAPIFAFADLSIISDARIFLKWLVAKF